MYFTAHKAKLTSMVGMHVNSSIAPLVPISVVSIGISSNKW